MRKKTPNVMGELLGDAPKKQGKTPAATPKATSSKAKTKTNTKKVASSKSGGKKQTAATESPEQNVTEKTVTAAAETQKRQVPEEKPVIKAEPVPVQEEVQEQITVEEVEEEEEISEPVAEETVEAEASAQQEERIETAPEPDYEPEPAQLQTSENDLTQSSLNQRDNSRSRQNSGNQIVKQMKQGVDFGGIKHVKQFAENPDTFRIPGEYAPKSNILRLGIDFGTANTTMVSERGTNVKFPSVVGYARDILGARLLDNGRAVGKSAIENQSFLDVFYPLENGVIKNNGEMYINAAKEILRTAVEAAQPSPTDRVCAVIGVPAKASSADKEFLLRTAKEVMDLALVVAAPYLIGYVQGRLSNSIIVDIGADTIGLCMLTGNAPHRDDQLMTLGAGNQVDSMLLNLIMEKHPEVQASKNQIKEIKEQYSYVGEPDREIFATFRVNGEPKKYEITHEVRMACESLIKPITEYIGMLLMKFPPENQESVLQNIYLAGGSSKIKNLNLAVQDGLSRFGNVKVQNVPEPDYSTCKGGLRLAMDVPLNQWTLVGDMIGDWRGL